MKKAAIGVALLFVLVVAMGQLFGDKEKSKARQVIEMCWDEQERKSLSAGEAQFIAGACERMEEDFLRKYGHKP